MNQTTSKKKNGRLPSNSAMIRVVGVGGAGNNALNRMIDEEIAGVEFIAVNTDQQDLDANLASKKLLIGQRLARGLGTGGEPEKGASSVEESLDELHELLHDSDMVFITAGMGGGTGTGASPVVARVAREVGALTIGVVTKPFTFEGTQRMRAAEAGIEKLKEEVDTLIVIPNDKLLLSADKRMPLKDSFKMADDVLRQGIQGISELITTPGLINLDFADVRKIMSVGGAALMAIGKGSGDDRARKAAEAALASHLLDVSIDGARGILFNVTGGSDLSLFEINEAANIIREMAHPDVEMIFGAVLDDSMEDELKITVIATGFGHQRPVNRPISRHEPRLPAVEQEATPAPQSRLSKPTQPPKREPRQQSLPIDDIDIPAFLRRKQ
ncbi:MAG: cell division protein FtsZ [Chloroflexota bacterium]